MTVKSESKTRARKIHQRTDGLLIKWYTFCVIMLLLLVKEVFSVPRSNQTG